LPAGASRHNHSASLGGVTHALFHYALFCS
jgi:hypothetical protein